MVLIIYKAAGLLATGANRTGFGSGRARLSWVQPLLGENPKGEPCSQAQDSEVWVQLALNRLLLIRPLTMYYVQSHQPR